MSSAECVGAALQGLVGTSSAGTLSIQQSGANLTARTTSDGTGEVCDLNGTAGTSSISLNGTYCSGAYISGLTCPNGLRRDMELVTYALSGTVSGNSLSSGTGAETYNLYVAGTRSGAGVMTVQYRFNGSRR